MVNEVKNQIHTHTHTPHQNLVMDAHKQHVIWFGLVWFQPEKNFKRKPSWKSSISACFCGSTREREKKTIHWLVIPCEINGINPKMIGYWLVPTESNAYRSHLINKFPIKGTHSQSKLASFIILTRKTPNQTNQITAEQNKKSNLVLLVTTKNH